MSLSINLFTNIIRVAAGEPIFFSYQSQTGGKVPEPLENRKFVFALYDGKREDRGYYEADIKLGVNPEAVWRLDGTVSEALLSYTGIKWEISERLDNGRDRIAGGTLVVDVSAPRIGDFDSAPMSRYITRITRANDPATIDKPVFEVVIRAYEPVAAIIPAPVFTAQPYISPAGGNVGASFTATDGIVINGAVTARRWLLGGTAIGTGATVIPASAGTLTLENTAVGIDGTTIKATSSVVTVTAVVTPTPTPTSTPSVFARGVWDDSVSWSDSELWADA